MPSYGGIQRGSPGVTVASPSGSRLGDHRVPAARHPRTDDPGTFLLFGLGFGLPLVALSFLTGLRAQTVVCWIVRQHRRIEVVAGVLLVVVAIADFIDKWESIALTLGIG